MPAPRNHSNTAIHDAMSNTALLHELILASSLRFAQQTALTFGNTVLSYGALANDVSSFAAGLMSLGLGKSERVGIYLDKRSETVIASFGAAAAGGVFVPLNPLLKPEQVAYILRDCNVRVLVTSPERLRCCAPVLLNAPTCGMRSSRPQTAWPCHRPIRRTASVARFLDAPGRARASRDRHRHGGDPLHVGQHRQAEGRRAVPPQHGGRRQERRVVPGEPRRTTRCSRRCRCPSTPASAS